MFEKPRVCKTCKKELGEFVGCQIPVYMPASASFNMPSGGVDLYCESCYKDATGETFLQATKDIAVEDKDFDSRLKDYRTKHPDITPITDVEIGKNVVVVGRVSSGLEHKELRKDNRPLKMSFFQLKDDTGKITLILWNSEQNIKLGDFYLIQGYVQEFNREKQLTLGFKGNLQRVFV